MKRKIEIMDGNQAAAHVAYAMSDAAAIYPITPSSGMAEWADEWAESGRKNIFGRRVNVTEMQSEAGAAGAVHGALAAGALTSTFTASQGLLLMIPNIYKIAGEHLPGVFYVAARAIATHALSIFGDHSDIYACRQTGAAMLALSNVQEVMDLSPVAHLSALSGSLPFINFFDGFRTSHEIQKIYSWDYEDLKEMTDFSEVERFRKNALSPEHAKQMGSAQNPDVFFQFREASNFYYDRLPGIVQKNMDRINERIGTDYKLFNYYGANDAEHIIIAMGSVCDTAEETIDKLNSSGDKTGLVKVRLYRPFSPKHLINAIPESVKQITVLNRTKEPGSCGEPLYLDVLSALKDSRFKNIPVFSGRYGLGSKDTTPEQIKAIFDNHEKRVFTIGIKDDVTRLSLDYDETENIIKENTICCKFWGLGGDGTVSANKSSIKIIGKSTDMHVQAYFEYDSKKSRGLTVSHLRFGEEPIKSSYLIYKADFAACHNPAYMHKYNIVQELKDGGVFLLNTPLTDEELDQWLPGQVKKYMAEHNINFYAVDGIGIGKETGLNGKINTILQAAFFKLSKIIPEEKAIKLMKEAAKAAYSKKGQEIVDMNYAAIEMGAGKVRRVYVKEDWKSCVYEPLDSDILEDREEMTEFVKNIQKPLNIQEGDRLPVSAFLKYSDGSVPSGSASHERRNTAVEIPVWKPENCIQCNRCSFVCPHAVIRPAVMNKEEYEKVPEGIVSVPMTGFQDYRYSIVISEVDCTGCGSCAGVCPGRKGEKALEMCPIAEHEENQEYFDYAKELPLKTEIIEKFKENTVKGSQFKKPMLEFHGACAGCGETPYAKLVTQLFGDRMYIANATGCSSIWGNSYPSTPYTVDFSGRGPAWSNSLFEDAAEFGYGMLIAQETIREGIKQKLAGVVENAINEKVSEDKIERLKEAKEEWIKTMSMGKENRQASERLIKALNECGTTLCKNILMEKDFFAKKSQWIFGGDGWAYDIGFGGLDHVLASKSDINMLVFDTEVYSNTGGQASKATPMGAYAKFVSGGKRLRKKPLAEMIISYGYVYVAQVAMGADYNQTIRAITEAEAYNGPSLIIAYSPCISHGIKAGMGSAQHEEKKAVESGYWNLFRYNPELINEGKNPLILDSRNPQMNYREFLRGEIRYSVLEKSNPEKAEELFSEAEKTAEKTYDKLLKLSSEIIQDKN